LQAARSDLALVRNLRLCQYSILTYFALDFVLGTLDVQPRYTVKAMDLIVSVAVALVAQEELLLLQKSDLVSAEVWRKLNLLSPLRLERAYVWHWQRDNKSSQAHQGRM
jgi:hypothetical protein